MKFKWINNFVYKRRDKKEAEESWHVWYAWYPVDVGDWDFRWLENVERIAAYYYRRNGCSTGKVYQYRPLKETKDES